MGMDLWSNRTSDGRTPRRLVGAALAMVVAGAIFAPSALAASPAASCQPFASQPCLLPFPNNLFTVKDSSSATGLRVHLPQAAMPTNTVNSQINVAEYNRNDGFSPGSDVIVKVPGLDNPTAFNNTNPVQLDDMSKAFKPSAPIVVIDAATGQRHLIWAELDSNAGSAANTTLLIHPGKNFVEGHRYIVAMRESQEREWQHDQRAQLVREAPRSQDAARRRAVAEGPLRGDVQDPEAGRNQPEQPVRGLELHGHASRQSLSARMLKIRDNAFSQLGDTNLADNTAAGSPPSFSVTGNTANPAPGIMSEVTGTYTVPCYLNDTGCAPTPTSSTDGGGFHYSSNNPNATPTQKPGNTTTAQFDCIIPTSAATTPARASLYGHGLLGSRTEVDRRERRGDGVGAQHDVLRHRLVGPGERRRPLRHRGPPGPEQVPGRRRPAPAGGSQHPLPGPLMRTSGGFASDPAFQTGGSVPLFDTSRGYYDGNSQGGIMGGMTTAVAPDFTPGGARRHRA